MSGIAAWWRSAVDLVAPRLCAGCDWPLDPGEWGWCGGCVVLLEPSAQPGAAFAFGGPLADGVRRLKYAARTDLIAALGALLAQAAERHAGSVDAVVPVPLHRRRLAERGFNQAALLARPVARQLGVKLQTSRLRRVRPTPPQAGLDADARGRNVRGAFVAQPDPHRPRVLLVDDVRTTGATLHACAHALRLAGTAEVRLLALAAVDHAGGRARRGGS